MKLQFFALCAATLFATSSQTQAQSQCGTAQAIRHLLTNKYKEQPIEAIKCNQQAVCERWINYDTGTWTWIIYPREGIACYLAVGEIGSQL